MIIMFSIQCMYIFVYLISSHCCCVMNHNTISHFENVMYSHVTMLIDNYLNVSNKNEKEVFFQKRFLLDYILYCVHI